MDFRCDNGSSVADAHSPFLYDWEPWYVVVPIRKEHWYTDRGMLSVLLAESAYRIVPVSVNSAKQGLHELLRSIADHGILSSHNIFLSPVYWVTQMGVVSRMGYPDVRVCVSTEVCVRLVRLCAATVKDRLSLSFFHWASLRCLSIAQNSA